MMKLKPLGRQVIVIVGASSGIGPMTARRAAEHGAKIVLAARDGTALDQIALDIRALGGEAIAVPTDVSVAAQVDRLAAKAIATYGGFDTWITNADLSVLSALTKIDDAHHRQLFDLTFWGLVYGSKIAAKHLRGKGGAIINLGSIASDLTFPHRGMHSATNHAIKGFTDALRAELVNDGAGVAVTFITPPSIDTPLPARTMTDTDTELKRPPVYQPKDMVEAVLIAAAHAGRDDVGGGGGTMMSSFGRFSAATSQVASSQAAQGLRKAEGPRRGRGGALNDPGHDGGTIGAAPLWVRSSLYTRTQIHPLVTAGLMTAAALAGAALIARLED